MWRPQSNRVETYRTGKCPRRGNRKLTRLLPPHLLARRASAEYNFSMPSVLPSLKVKVLFFGRLKELTSLVEDTREMPDGSTLADLFSSYAQRFPALADFRSSLVASRNQEFSAWDTRLASGDEIAFLPPVSGG